MKTQYLKENVEKIVSESQTIKECLIKLGRPISGDNYNYFIRLITKLNIDISHFLSKSEQGKLRDHKTKWKWEDIFCKNSPSQLNGTNFKIKY
jgi:hypothetical protein